ncbi:MAG TPA: type 1 glutamine amidotransferase domain-containing protein [Anaerolineales bacterium]|nr:type 1 glutamine amidotransferase domain-containing protein [Anaerolineales bacterium]
MSLQGKEIAILVDAGYEDLEFWVPLMRLQEAGAKVTVVGIESGKRVLSKSGGLAAVAEAAARDLSPDRFTGIVVPGGWAPDKLRRDEGVTALVRGIHEQGKVVAMICHAGLVGISAGIVKGHRATGSMGIKDDLVNAGATWVDEAAFRDGNLVWGRVVPDIPAFCRELMGALSSQ